MRGVRKSSGQGEHSSWGVTHGATADDVFTLVIELSQTISLIIAIPHSFIAHLPLLPGVAPFLPLALAFVRIMTRSRKRQRLPAPAAEEVAETIEGQSKSGSKSPQGGEFCTPKT